MLYDRRSHFSETRAKRSLPWGARKIQKSVADLFNLVHLLAREGLHWKARILPITKAAKVMGFKAIAAEKFCHAPRAAARLAEEGQGLVFRQRSLKGPPLVGVFHHGGKGHPYGAFGRAGFFELW